MMINIDEMRRRLARWLSLARIEWVAPCRSCGLRPVEFDGLCSWCSFFATVRK